MWRSSIVRHTSRYSLRWMISFRQAQTAPGRTSISLSPNKHYTTSTLCYFMGNVLAPGNGKRHSRAGSAVSILKRPEPLSAPGTTYLGYLTPKSESPQKPMPTVQGSLLFRQHVPETAQTPRGLNLPAESDHKHLRSCFADTNVGNIVEKIYATRIGETRPERHRRVDFLPRRLCGLGSQLPFVGRTIILQTSW